MTEAASPAARPAGSRPRFTGRAAILAVVLCAIALSLAYPVREYIGQRRQIDQLTAQRATAEAAVRRLQAEDKKLTSPAYVEQQARDRLHMCMPGQTCYVVIPGKKPPVAVAPAPAPVTPWYEKLWGSVRAANQATSP